MTLLEHVRPSGPVGDAELIGRVRAGDLDAYGTLFDRHRTAATRLARAIAPPADADDLVSDAFVKVLDALRRGKGPDLAFRPYLLTAVRRCHVDRIRASTRTTPTDDVEVLDGGEEFTDPAVAGFENAAATRAFRSLPERWQMVLWHLDVEGQKPADVAPLLAMSPNAVSALAYRAREGLRQAYLRMHASEIEDEECRAVRELLGGYVRRGLSRRDGHRVEEHLQHCRPCTALYLELSEVNRSLAAVLGPLVLGSAAAAYLAASGATGGGLVALGALAGRARDAVVAHTQAAIAVGAAAAVAAGVTVGLAVMHPEGEPVDMPIAVEAPPPSTAPTASTGQSGEPPAARERRTPAPDAAVPATAPVGAASAPAPDRPASTTPSTSSTPSTPSTPATTPPSTTPTPPTGTPPATPPATSATAPPDGGSGAPPTALGLTASVVDARNTLLGLRADVAIHVRGLPPGRTATLTLRLPPGGVFVARPAGCSDGGLVSVCTVDGDDPDLLTTVRGLDLLGLHVRLDSLLGLPVVDLLVDLLP